MENILSYINKWGMAIMLFLGMIIFFNTCGVKGNQEQTERKIKSLEQTIKSQDSIAAIKSHLEMELYNLKVERSVLHNMNEIVLKNIRPAEKISQIDKSIDDINQKLRNIK